MVLEDQGVRIEAFTELQENAVADARTIHDSCNNFRSVLDEHGLGRPYRLSHLLKRIEELELDLIPRKRIPSFDTPFFKQIREVSMVDILRDIKHSARIRIPESYLLVGIADEGPAYQAEGKKNVYILPENRIYGVSGIFCNESAKIQSVLKLVCKRRRILNQCGCTVIVPFLEALWYTRVTVSISRL